MTSIIQKRRSLHQHLEQQQQNSQLLKKEIGHLQALANLGTATCMIAHEVNNLLTPLSNYAALALKYPQDASLTEKALRRTKENCEQASKVMETILSVANGQLQEKQNVKLLQLVNEVFICLCRDFKKDNINVKINVPEDLEVWANPIEFQQVLMNLILNARDAMLTNGGTLSIMAEENDDYVKISVSDTGCGIESEYLDKIFQPFFTTKKDGNENSRGELSGTGLGLAFCKRVIDEHKATITVESEPKAGSKFEIIIPKQL